MLRLLLAGLRTLDYPVAPGERVPTAVALVLVGVGAGRGVPPVEKPGHAVGGVRPPVVAGEPVVLPQGALIGMSGKPSDAIRTDMRNDVYDRRCARTTVVASALLPQGRVD